jgi:hypothetical protein
MIDGITLAITWPQGLHPTKENHLEAAQVDGIVRPGLSQILVTRKD